MIKKILLLSFLGFLALGCSENTEDLSEKTAIGGPRYGGEFRFMSAQKVSTLFPLQAIELYTQRITSQLFDPLLRLDASGENVIPSIAESFSTSSDGKTYTFKIRKGVYFIDDECFGGDGRELTAEDVKFTLDMSCSGMKINEISYMLINRVSGAREFNKATKTKFIDKGVSGIKVVDNYTVQISLDTPFAGFEKLLTYSGFGIFPKEAYDMYGKDIKNHPVGTGAFKLEEKTDKHIRLVRNPNYWRKDQFGNQLPFLGSIEMTYSKEKKSELMAFRKEEIDLVLEIPADEVENILGSLQEAQEGKTVKHKVDSKPSFSVAFIGLSHVNPAFKDVRTRRAFDMAIDREDLINNTMKGEGYPVLNGFVPNSDFFPASRVKGNKFNPEMARKLLAESGFTPENFPTLILYVSDKQNGDRHQLALGVARQLKANLGVTIQVKLVDLDIRNQYASNGKAAMWVTGWVADYPDGENFLSLFYGNNIDENSKFINPFKYKSKKFDSLFEQANKELNPKKRTDLLVACDQELTNDAAVLPLSNDDFITMINSRVRNFETNSLENLDFSSIFIKEPKDGSK